MVRNQPEWGKIWTRKTPNMDTFQAVSITDQNPEAVSDLFGQRDHTIVFFTHFAFKSVLSHVTC